jgi:hypothetical protein
MRRRRVVRRRETGFRFMRLRATSAGVARSAHRPGGRESPFWWGNIRFEETFTPESKPPAASGCVAGAAGRSGVGPVVRAHEERRHRSAWGARGAAFTDAGIMVHAHLIRLPVTEIEQDHRRAGACASCSRRAVQSAYWHRFSATAHAPIGLNLSYGRPLHAGHQSAQRCNSRSHRHGSRLRRRLRGHL